MEGARIERGAQIAPNSVVPPGRLIPANQLWGGNPVEFIKDLDIGEQWANYTQSYLHSAIGDVHRNEFTLWPSNYLQKESTQDDVEPSNEDLIGQYVAKNYFEGSAKHFS